MNILLVNPSGGPEAEYGALARASTELPQLRLIYLAAVLKEAQHYVRIVDFYAEALTIEDLLRIVTDGKGSITGLLIDF